MDPIVSTHGERNPGIELNRRRQRRGAPRARERNELVRLSPHVGDSPRGLGREEHRPRSVARARELCRRARIVLALAVPDARERGVVERALVVFDDDRRARAVHPRDLDARSLGVGTGLRVDQLRAGRERDGVGGIDVAERQRERRRRELGAPGPGHEQRLGTQCEVDARAPGDARPDAPGPRAERSAVGEGRKRDDAFALPGRRDHAEQRRGGALALTVPARHRREVLGDGELARRAGLAGDAQRRVFAAESEDRAVSRDHHRDAAVIAELAERRRGVGERRTVHLARRGDPPRDLRVDARLAFGCAPRNAHDEHALGRDHPTRTRGDLGGRQQRDAFELACAGLDHDLHCAVCRLGRGHPGDLRGGLDLRTTRVAEVDALSLGDALDERSMRELRLLGLGDRRGRGLFPALANRDVAEDAPELAARDRERASTGARDRELDGSPRRAVIAGLPSHLPASERGEPPCARERDPVGGEGHRHDVPGDALVAGEHSMVLADRHDDLVVEDEIREFARHLSIGQPGHRTRGEGAAGVLRHEQERLPRFLGDRVGDHPFVVHVERREPMSIRQLAGDERLGAHRFAQQSIAAVGRDAA